MDKDVQKRLLRDAGIPTAKFLVFRKEQVSNSPFRKARPVKSPLLYGGSTRRLRREGFSFSQVVSAVGLPLFVKPANAGSSVGVHKVKKESDFKSAIEDAFKYDSKILIEEAIDGREIECAVLGNERPIASVPGEIKPNHEFYSYEAKYIDENGAACEIPAKLSAKITQKVRGNSSCGVSGA
jgi:D-alanine-D-alanine ligase